MPREKTPPTFRLLPWALGLYTVWVLATYLLEGRILTLLRPEATGARLAYAVGANLIVGVGGAGLFLRATVRHAGINPHQLAFRGVRRTVFSLALGFGLGLAAFVLQQPTTFDPILIGNAFAQVWVVSVAEVLVCWGMLGTAIAVDANIADSRWTRILVALVVSAVAFGVYHVAHSPPFNTTAMVGLLTGVGLVTGAFFFTVGELYGTLLFHNFMALKGVTDALAKGGQLEHFATLQLPLLVTALVATGALLTVDRVVRRQSASGASSSA